MYVNCVVVSKSEFHFSGMGMFCGRGEYEFAFNLSYCKPSFKNQWGEAEGLTYFCSLECFDCWWVGDGGVRQKVLFRAG